MKRILHAIILVMLAGTGVTSAQEKSQKDSIFTSEGNLEITFVGHATLMFKYNGKIVHVDPVSREADYSKMPKADIVLVTHEHGDHLDPDVLKILRKDNTKIILPEKCAGKVKNSIVMKNGDIQYADWLKIEAVPAYNIVHKRNDGQPFHPRGDGNGYVVTFGNKRVYIAGDTENTPEMKGLKSIDVALLPMNVPYTMSPEMVADAVYEFKPAIIYPYHYGQTDPATLIDLLKDVKESEVRIREMR